jgi:hypothetical protein
MIIGTLCSGDRHDPILVEGLNESALSHPHFRFSKEFECDKAKLSRKGRTESYEAKALFFMGHASRVAEQSVCGVG